MQLLLGMVSPKQTYLTSADIVTAVIVFGIIAAKVEIVWQHVVPLNSMPRDG